MMWVFVVLVVISFFMLGVRYERFRQHQLKIDYMSGMGAMWNQRPRDGESDDDFRVRLVRAMVDSPDACRAKPI